MDAELKAELRRINEKLSFLIEKEKERVETWVKVSVIKKRTVFETREQLRQARNMGYLVQRKDKKKGIVYLLESVPQQFLKTA